MKKTKKVVHGEEEGDEEVPKKPAPASAKKPKAKKVVSGEGEEDEPKEEKKGK